jgi:phosphoesterase RecJ-like protein
MTVSDRSKILEILESGDALVMASHRRPDGDAVGTMLALLLRARALGRRAEALCPGGVPEPYGFLAGADSVAEALPPGFDDFHLVIVDTPDGSRSDAAGAAAEAARTVINIDHHPDNTRYGDLNLVDSSASSAALLVAELLDGLDGMSREVATALYTGVLTDTGGFRFGNTDARTLSVASKLVESGAKPARVASAVYGEQSIGALRLLGMVLASTELALDGRMAVSLLTKAMKDECDSDGVELEGLASYGRMVRGVEVAVLVREEDGRIRASLRSRGPVDVNAVASSLGGGGHRAAAGVVMDGTVEEARRRLVEAVAKAMDRN